MSLYDFFTIYTSSPHNLIKDKRIDLNERTFQREDFPFLACNDRNAFSLRDSLNILISCQYVCDTLNCLLDNSFILFGAKLYTKSVGIPIGTASLVADLFLFSYERDFMMSLSDDKQADIIDALNTTSRYFDDIRIMKSIYFDNMVS